jgi:flagellar basal body-associated protein FliL
MGDHLEKLKELNSESHFVVNSQMDPQYTKELAAPSPSSGGTLSSFGSGHQNHREETSSGTDFQKAKEAEVPGSDNDPFIKETPLNLDEELEFNPANMTRGAFAAKIIFVTIITVILFTMFVAVFYFVFTARAEKRVVQKSVEKTVEDIFQDLRVLLSKDQLKTLASIIDQIPLPDLKKEDAEARSHNTNLMKKSFFYLGIGAVVLLAVLVIYYFVMRGMARHKLGPEVATRGVHYPAMGTVFFVSGMGFVGVVIAEFVFLYLIAARFQPLDSYQVRRDIVQAIINYAYCSDRPCPTAQPYCYVDASKGDGNLPVLTRKCSTQPPIN